MSHHDEYEQGYARGVMNEPYENPYSPISYEYERWSEGYSKGFANYR